VPADLASEVAFLFRERGWYLQKYVDDRLIVENMDENALFYSNYAKVQAIAVGEEFYRMNAPSTKMLAMADSDSLDVMQAVLRERFGEKLYVAPSKKTFLEIVNPVANKGNALAYLADRLGISSSSVMAIGDSMNDIDMIVYAGRGIAMGNAHAAVKNAADAVTLGNADDGVAAALERFVLT
jgi:Cof subfamily protein (haloacid dehalogenase superfamily)